MEICTNQLCKGCLLNEFNRFGLGPEAEGEEYWKRQCDCWLLVFSFSFLLFLLQGVEEFLSFIFLLFMEFLFRNLVTGQHLPEKSILWSERFFSFCLFFFLLFFE